VSLGGVLLIEGERIPVEFDAPSSARLLRATAAGKRARQRQLDRTVVHYLAAHPDATANEVHRSIGGRRADVLRAVLAARSSDPSSHTRSPGRDEGRAVLGPGYQVAEWAS